MYYIEDQKLGFLQYEELFYDLLSRLVTNEAHITAHKNYYEHFIFKSFEAYNNSKTEISIRQIVVLFEIALDSMFRYKPSVDLPEDVITIF